MASDMKAAALAYAARGLPIFPCRRNKQPYTDNGVIDATTDPQRISEWFECWPLANIGLDCGGAGYMVVDLDPGHDFDTLDKAVGGLPETKLRQRTPRGGEHLFYALNPGEIVSPSASKLAPKVDVRSFHSYVLLAPSVTDDGAYEWLGSPEAKPAHRTDEMVRLANSHREKHGDRDNWIIEPDLPENMEAATRWLRNDARIAIEGQGGDAMAYATAAHLKSFGISQSTAMELIWEHWNPRCIPPWTADEIEHLETKVRNGYTYNSSPPGNITTAYRVAKSAELFKPVRSAAAEGSEFTAGRFRVVDRAGMDAIAPPEWLVTDLMQRDSYTILFGGYGTFKTFIALDLALSVATGIRFPWDGCWPDIAASGPVLFAAGEARSNIPARIKAWEQTYWNKERVDGIRLIDPVPLVSENTDPFFEAALAASPSGYRLVVLDTVGRSMQGLNENAQEHASKFTALVESVQRNLGASVLALHHTGYGNENRARGSSVFGTDADTMVRIDRAGKDRVVSLTMTKQKDAEEWDHSKAIALKEVDISKKITSLVPTPVTAADAPPPRAKRDPTRNDGAILTVLDNAVRQVLQGNPLKEWTTKDLGEAVAMRPDIDISGKTLRNHQLPALRENSTTFANKCYDAAKKRWRSRS